MAAPLAELLRDVGKQQPAIPSAGRRRGSALAPRASAAGLRSAGLQSWPRQMGALYARVREVASRQGAEGLPSGST